MENSMTIKQAIDGWLSDMGLNKEYDPDEKLKIIQEHTPPPHTARSYKNASMRFSEMLEGEYKLVGESPLAQLRIEHFIRYIAWIKTVYISEETKDYVKTATARMYIAGVRSFYKWLLIKDHFMPSPNDDKRYEMAYNDVFKRGSKRFPHMAEVGAVEAVMAKALEVDEEPIKKARNIAIVYLMARSGLRIHEVCKLKIKDIDLGRCKGVIIGKDDKQAFFRFSKEVSRYITEYLRLRKWGMNDDDPLFAAHDKSIGKAGPRQRHRHLTTTAVRIIIGKLAADANVELWPHAIRHYFVTKTYAETKDIVLTQELARHSHMDMTKRYVDMMDEEIDQKYREVYDREDK